MLTKADKNWQQWLYTRLFENVPCNISIIDRDFIIVENNRNFLDLFGDGRGKKCYQIYKRRSSPCPECAAMKTFQDGKTRVNEEVGVDRMGRTAYYIVHLSPIYDENGDIPYIVEMSTDISETKRLQREYQVLFERVPCYIAVLNRKLGIVRANEHFRKTFGDAIGKQCYEVYKKKGEKCVSCPAELTFRDGKVHTAYQEGTTADGQKTYYMVTTSPLTRDEDPVTNVIEISLDVTELRQLEAELQQSHLFRQKIIEHSAYGLLAFDTRGALFLINPAAEDLFKIKAEDLIGQLLPASLIPEKFLTALMPEHGTVTLEGELTTQDGEVVPVSIASFGLESEHIHIGRAFFIHDLRARKKLEKDKIDAERLAAVGQTVASLAHGIKNILMGLEGGMYIMSTGLHGGKTERLHQGWEILERNIGKISNLAKNLLNFSKGRKVNPTLIKPHILLRDVFDLFQQAAEQENIILSLESAEDLPAVAFDQEELHTCLVNLVSNAIDACKMSVKTDCTVVLKCYNKDRTVYFEICDQGCGMDYEVKQKVFTNFFTTKGTEGTGLGLLTTRKIVQEHGGTIEFESIPGQGSCFRLVFPEDNLPVPTHDNEPA